MNKYMPVEEMKTGYLYAIHARNASYGIWDSIQGGFWIRRTKFKEIFTFVEIHWDLDDHFGTAKPIMELDKSPFTQNDLLKNNRNAEMLRWLKQKAEYWQPRL